MASVLRKTASVSQGRRPSSRFKLGCPNCSQQQLVRVARHGFLRSHVLSFLGLYPWECAGCGRKFIIPMRSAG